MGWNFENNEDKKEYSVNGTVTISTEEYRDLIVGIYDAKSKAQKEHDDWYSEYKRAEEFKKKCETNEKRLVEINEWLDSDALAKDNFKNWKLEKIALRESEEE